MSSEDKLDLWFKKTDNEEISSKVSSLWRYKDDPFADLVVRVLAFEGELETEFSVHKLILGLSSPVFARALFKTPVKPKEGTTTSQQGIKRTVLEIKQYPSSIFKLVLEFMYTSSIALLQEPALRVEAIGGLLFAAKRYKINKLAEFCLKIVKDDMTYERALDNFDKLLDPKISTSSKISRNKELLKHYFAYILKYGEHVLRTKRFRRVSVVSLEWICSADFLCASELTVYRAIFWWAREQCQEQKLKDTVENCRRVLKINDNSVGIMRYVRFSRLDPCDFTLKVDRNDKRYQLLPESMLDNLCKAELLEESTNLCDTTLRTKEYEDDLTNKQYVDSFVEKKVKDMLSKPVNQEVVRNISTAPVDSQTPVVPMSYVAETPIPKETSKPVSTLTSVNSSDTGISSVESKSFLADDQERDSSKKVVEESSKAQGKSNGLSVELATGNVTGESHCRRMLFVTPQKEDEFPVSQTPNLSALSSPEEAYNREPESTKTNSVDKIVHQGRLNPITMRQPPTLTNFPSTTFNSVNKELAMSQSQTSGGINSHSTPRATASQPTHFKSPSVNPKKKATLQLSVQPKKPRKRVYKENSNSATPVSKVRKVLSQKGNRIQEKSSSGEANAYELREKVITYQYIINEFSKRNTFTEYILNDRGIKEFKKRSSCFKSVQMPYLKNFSVEFVSSDTKTNVALIKDLSEISLDHYIFFYRDNEDPSSRLTDLWNRQVNVKLSFCGISVFEMLPKSGKLVINYTKNSSFLQLNQMKVDNLKSLNLANCAIQQKNWLNADCSEHLTELRLFCVRTLKCQNIIKECTNLQHLSIWPATVGAKLSLKDLNASGLLSLAANNVVITYSVLDLKPFNLMETICFQDCTWDDDFVDNFRKLFPNLRRISVSSKYCQPGPDLLRILTQMESVRHITVWNFDLKRLELSEFADLKVFLQGLGIQKSGKECHFRLKRDVNAEWKGCNASFEKQSSQVYDMFGWSKFYSIDKWQKIWSNLV